MFNESPPYELLSSATFSLEDILFCQSFNRAYYSKLRFQLQSDEGRQLAAGGVSHLVRRFMTEGQGDARAFMQTLANEQWQKEKTLGSLSALVRRVLRDSVRNAAVSLRNRARLTLSGSFS